MRSNLKWLAAGSTGVMLITVAGVVGPNSSVVTRALADPPSITAEEVGPAQANGRPEIDNDTWPQWRGPRRDGSSPVILPEQLPKQLKSVWSVEVGLGHSTPIVADGRLFVHTREDESEIVRELELATGTEVWKLTADAPYAMNPSAGEHGKGPKSTPLYWQGLLFTLSITGTLTAIDVESREILWRDGFEEEFGASAPIYGAAMSPLLAGSLLIAHVGGHHDGALTAFDPHTGERHWELRGDGPSYASPILVEAAGRRQLVTQTDSNLIGVDASDGALLWSVPFTTDYDQNVVSSVRAMDLLVFSGLNNGTVAYTLESSAFRNNAATTWVNERVSMYLSTPVLINGRLFGLSHLRRGQFFALDAASGKIVWTSSGREGENASFVSVGNRVLALTDSAQLLVIDAAAERYEPLARYEVADSATWAHPVLTNVGVLIKALDTLALWSFE